MGTCITSKTQSRGVGKPGASWVSPPGNMYASYILADPNLEPHILIQAATVAAVRVLPDQCQIKWLNDLVVNNRKVGGIICDRVPEMNRVVVGVGLNLQNPSISSSILQETGILLEPMDMSVQYGNSLAMILSQLDIITAEFNNKLAYRNTVINFVTNGAPRIGVLVGVSRTGELEISTERGLELYKECQIVPTGYYRLSAPGGN